MFKVMKKLKTLLFGSLLLIPQLALADLTIKPFLPAGNLSISDPSLGAPYQMEESGRRAYADIWTYSGISEFGSDIAYDTKGIDIAVGFDYKVSTGYLSASYAQRNSTTESTKFDTESNGYEVKFDIYNSDILLQYIHEIDDESTLGVLLNNKSIEMTQSDSVDNGTKNKGTVKFSYLTYSVFTKIALTTELSLGFLVSPAVNQTEKYDGDFSTEESTTGHGTRVEAALGWQTEKMAFEVLLHNENEQPEAEEGTKLKVDLSGEVLVKDRLSVVGTVSQTAEADVEYKGDKTVGTDEQVLVLGVNFQTNYGTYSIDVRNLKTSSEDDKTQYSYLQLSALLSF